MAINNTVFNAFPVFESFCDTVYENNCHILLNIVFFSLSLNNTKISKINIRNKKIPRNLSPENVRSSKEEILEETKTIYVFLETQIKL